jgi:hypothetical protein
MSTHPTFPATTERLSAGIDLTLALVSLSQALRVSELAHTGCSNIMENLPRDVSLEDIREKTEDSLLLFGLAMRLVVERNLIVVGLSQKLIDF